jgi:N-acetylglucosamine kinase-like BadF-type ATPase
MAILLADSGATKCEWCLAETKRRTRTVITQGISPYFLDAEQIENILRNELLPGLKKPQVDAVYYYGTGTANPDNARMIKKVIAKVFKGATVEVTTDLVAAARGLCGHEKGMACNLGTGSFACYYDGRKIAKLSAGIGYVLGDEGSGAYLGKKVIQYYLYNTFDEELRYKFDEKYKTDRAGILENVYKKPLPNRYLASFSMFLAENRNHFMIENIIEDGLNDFFFTHLCKYNESWKLPIHFTGGIAWAFRDVVMDLCNSYQFEPGVILRAPMEGLVKYHVK